MKSFRITLRDLHFHAHHGVFQQEQIVGNEFIVNANIMISAEDFNPEHDELAATISYADIYQIISDEMNNPKRLIETVAVKIAQRLKQQWSNIESGEIEIIKLSPPIPGIVGEAGMKYFF